MTQCTPITPAGGLHSGRRRQKTGAACLVIGLTLLALPALASPPVESIQRIRDAAAGLFVPSKEAGTSKTRVEVGRIDDRIVLPACDRALDAELPGRARTSGRIAVLVSCKGERPWRLYVPVEVSILAQVAVARRDLLRGDVISQGDLRLAERDLARLSAGYVRDTDELVGRRLRGQIRAGKVVSRRVTEMVPVVKTGQRVEFLAGSTGVDVRTTVTALSDGRPGDRIRVRNDKTARILHGIVRASGAVEAGP